MHFAATAAGAEGVQVLLEFGADPNVREGRWGQTPLMFAAASGRTEVVDALLRHGADPELRAHVLDMPTREAEDRADQQAWEAARRNQTPPATARGTQLSAPRALERPAATPSGSGNEEDVVRSYSEADLIGGYGGLSALLLAVREGSTEVALRLVDGGADIDGRSAGDGTTPSSWRPSTDISISRSNCSSGALIRICRPTRAPRRSTRPSTPSGFRSPGTRSPAHYMQQDVDLPRRSCGRFCEAGVDPNVRLTKQLWFTSSAMTTCVSTAWVRPPSGVPRMRSISKPCACWSSMVQTRTSRP